MSRRDARFAVADMVEYLDRALKFVAQRDRVDLDTDLMLEMASSVHLKYLAKRRPVWTSPPGTWHPGFPVGADVCAPLESRFFPGWSRMWRG